MDSWELTFGSDADLIPSEVATRILFTRAFMYESQIRWSIPQSASMAMILTISEILWEDVFYGSKRLTIHYIRQDNVAFNQKKVQSVTDMLRVALIDFYRRLGMLKSFKLGMLKSFRLHTCSTFEVQSVETLALGTLIFYLPIITTCHFIFLLLLFHSSSVL
jgi:hypothetical protein